MFLSSMTYQGVRMDLYRFLMILIFLKLYGSKVLFLIQVMAINLEDVACERNHTALPYHSLLLDVFTLCVFKKDMHKIRNDNSKKRLHLTILTIIRMFLLLIL